MGSLGSSRFQTFTYTKRKAIIVSGIKFGSVPLAAGAHDASLRIKSMLTGDGFTNNKYSEILDRGVANHMEIKRE
jgi:hypothetical protein